MIDMAIQAPKDGGTFPRTKGGRLRSGRLYHLSTFFSARDLAETFGDGDQYLTATVLDKRGRVYSGQVKIEVEVERWCCAR
jgi:hypothetical protein